MDNNADWETGKLKSRWAFLNRLEFWVTFSTSKDCYKVWVFLQEALTVLYMQKGTELGKSSRLGPFWQGCEIPPRFDQMKQQCKSPCAVTWHTAIPVSFLSAFHFWLDQTAPCSACYKDPFFPLFLTLLVQEARSLNSRLKMPLRSRAPVGELLKYQPIPTWLVQD